MNLDNNAALIVIDMQTGFADPSWGPRNNPGCEANVTALLKVWADGKRPVILVRHDSTGTDSPLHPTNPGNALLDGVAAAPHELLVSKQVNSAFYGDPDLHAFLGSRGIHQLVICGIQTNMCVETTARMAGNLGYEVFVPLDATHTFDLAAEDGAGSLTAGSLTAVSLTADELTADELTRATAINLSGGGFAHVTTTSTLL